MTSSLIPFVLETIFHGTFLSVLCLLVLRAFRRLDKLFDSSRLIRAISFTLLLSSVIYITDFAVWFYHTIFSGGEYEQYVITTRFIGPYWWVFWIFLFLPYWLLPQILWTRKFRGSLICLLIVTVVWELSFTIRNYTPYYGTSEWSLYFKVKWSDYLVKFLCYLPIVSAVYFVLTLKEKREIKPNL